MLLVGVPAKLLPLGKGTLLGWNMREAMKWGPLAVHPGDAPIICTSMGTIGRQFAFPLRTDGRK